MQQENFRAAIYIRKSREDKDRPSHRLTVQREQLPAHARAQGWQVEIYDDGHASAAKGKADDLVERRRLEADVRAGKVQVILCIELSRLSRDETLEDYLSWLNLCVAHKVRLATLSRILDPSQTSDWMLLLMEGGFSSVEMKILQARMKEGRDQALRAGKWLGGNAPPPYHYRNGRLQVDTEQLPRMQKLWTLAETHSAAAISKQLGLPEIFVRRAIADDRLLLCQALRPDPDGGEPIPCDWPAVIDAEQAARIRSGRRTRRKTLGAGPNPVSLLSNLGLVYCGFCGGTIKTWNNSRMRRDGSRIDYYGCRGKSDRNACPQSRLIRQEELNERVVGNVFRTLRKLDDLKRAWHISQEQGDIPGQLKEIDRLERIAREKKTRLIDAVAEGLLTSSEVRDKRAAIDTEIDTLSSRRQTLLRQVATPPDWESMTLTQDDFSLLEPQEQRQLLLSLLARIDVYSGHALLIYRFPRNPNGDPTSRINFVAPRRPNHPSPPERFVGRTKP